ncbi:MAG: hypothetical protein LLG04_16075, partial [Parachlamydia sp.]|nr:hypothetical protein [Parachlamydia sp.]
SDAELGIDEICFIDLSKRMKRQYDIALAKKERARYGEGSLIMHMPAENLPQLVTAYRNSLYTAFKALVQKNTSGI